jgi:hypothetical protein
MRSRVKYLDMRVLIRFIAQEAFGLVFVSVAKALIDPSTLRVIYPSTPLLIES